MPRPCLRRCLCLLVILVVVATLSSFAGAATWGSPNNRGNSNNRNKLTAFGGSSNKIPKASSRTPFGKSPPAIDKKKKDVVKKKDDNNNDGAPGDNNWFYNTFPPVVRFLLSGSLGNVALYYSEKWIALGIKAILESNFLANLPGNDQEHRQELQNEIFDILTKYDDTISFFVGYLAHIPAQHLLYAFLVFGLQSINTPRKYFFTLFGTYSALSVGLVGSTILNSILRQNTDMDKTVCFLLTLSLFSGFNYFILGWIVRKTSSSAADGSNLDEVVQSKNKFRIPGKQSGGSKKR